MRSISPPGPPRAVPVKPVTRPQQTPVPTAESVERRRGTGARRHRTWWSLTVTVLLCLSWVLAGPTPPASAHATLLFATPAFDSAVPTSPRAVQLVFDEPVVATDTSLRLEDPAGRPFALSGVKVADKAQTISARVEARLPAGQYVVKWRIVADDGDTIASEYRFVVGSTSGLTLGAGPVQTQGLPATTVLRWALFAGLALALGGLLGARLARRRRHTAGDPRPWTRAGTAIGALASAGLALQLVGDGSITHGVTSFSVAALTASQPGRLVLLELAAFLAAGALLWADRRVLSIVGAVVLLLVPGAEGARSHPQGALPGVGAVVIGVHLAAAAGWVGALIHVLRVARARRRVGVRSTGLVLGYSRLALGLFLAVVLTGSLSALILIPPSELVSTVTTLAYGRWLVIKIAFVGVVAALALLARRFLARSPQLLQPARSTAYEAVVLVVILGLSGLLTSLAPPARSDTELPFAPPASGPVVAVGSRAGFIGIGATASSGQLVVQLSTPDASPAVKSEGDPTLSLAGNVVPDAGSARNLTFRGCGSGCFVAPIDWATGQSTVALRAASQSWAGGTAAVSISWPPSPGAAELRSITDVMRTIPELVVHEQVTSDTSHGPGSASRLRLSGRKFLSTVPYGSGAATSVSVLTTSRGETTLALSFPAEALYVLLTVDAHLRIVRESLAGPTHLASRTFVYPEADLPAETQHPHPGP